MRWLLPASSVHSESTAQNRRIGKGYPMNVPGGNHITIIYCAECAYVRRAIRMAENILEEFFEFLPGGVHVVPGSHEIFDVYLNQDRLFSKAAVGRHANDREVEDRLIELLEG